MNQSELIRMVKTIIRKEFAQMLLAKVTGTDNSYLSSMRRFVTDNEVSDLRLIFPYGFNSRPPEDTECVIAAINSDPSHLVNLGQFDNGNRPTIDDGESILYGPDGQVILMKSGGDIQFGTYLAETGTLVPTYFGKIDTQTGEITFHNLSEAELNLAADGTATLGNAIGSFEIAPSGMASVDGGTGASHGIGLGDVIESRLSALESALSSFITSYTSHVHATAAPGPPSPPIPPGVPFIAVPTPAASISAQVST